MPVSPRLHLIVAAAELSKQSPCQSKRGVVIFDRHDYHIISRGYNYKPRPFPCDGSDACRFTCRYEAVHAEQQALLLAGKQSDGADMLHLQTRNDDFVTAAGPSCVQCGKLALVAGIKGFWLLLESGWHRYDMVEYHRQALEQFHTSELPLCRR